MTAPDKNSATLSDGVVDWLTNGTRDQRFIDNIFAEMCIRLQQAGIPLARSTLHVLIQHPQWARGPLHVVRRHARGGDRAGRL
ncbi:hypothetical protein ACVW0I_001923 [Bradyrhizobium sp. LM6.11]